MNETMQSTLLSACTCSTTTGKAVIRYYMYKVIYDHKQYVWVEEWWLRVQISFFCAYTHIQVTCITHLTFIVFIVYTINGLFCLFNQFMESGRNYSLLGQTTSSSLKALETPTPMSLSHQYRSWRDISAFDDISILLCSSSFCSIYNNIMCIANSVCFLGIDIILCVPF